MALEAIVAVYADWGIGLKGTQPVVLKADRKHFRDVTGSDAVNEKLSNKRAESVAAYLKSCGIDASRMTTEGKSYLMPVADNATAEGRAQNRRVEIYISANENMIKAAEEGKLQ